MDNSFHRSTETEQALTPNTLHIKADSVSFGRQTRWLHHFFHFFLSFSLLRGSRWHCCWLLWPLFHPCCHTAHITQSMYLVFNQQFLSLTLCSLGWLLTVSLLSHSWHAWHWSCSLQVPSVCLLTLAPSLHQGSHTALLGSTEPEPFLACSWGYISIQPLNTHLEAACCCSPLYNLPRSAANPCIRSFLHLKPPYPFSKVSSPIPIVDLNSRMRFPSPLTFISTDCLLFHSQPARMIPCSSSNQSFLCYPFLSVLPLFLYPSVIPSP